MTVLSGAEVFAPESLGRADVLVGFSSILSVAPNLAKPLQTACSDVSIIDLRGLSLTPGLIDSHFHPLGGGDLAGEENRRGKVDVNSILRHGITSGVGVLAADTRGRTIDGLHLLGLDLRRSGFSLFHLCGSVTDPVASISGSVAKDVAHVDACLGVKIAISESLCEVAAEELGKSAIESVSGARLAGKTGMVHLHVGNQESGLDPLYDLIDRTGLPASVFQPTHVNRLVPDLMASAIPFIADGGTVDLTATLPFGGGPADRLRLVDAVDRLLVLGAPIEQITFSSDGNVTLPTRTAEGTFTGWLEADAVELVTSWREFVQKSRLSFETALLPVTRNPARVLGLEGRKGVIGENADADLVAWSPDLEPIFVMAGGRIVVDQR